MIPGGLFENGRIAIFGSQEERPQAIKLLESIPKRQCIDLIGQVSLLGAYACLKRCICFIGNDSGLMHLAAAAGPPTLGLFGPTSDAQYGPWSSESDGRARALRGERSRDQIIAEEGDAYFGESAVTDVSVDMVEEAAREMLARFPEVA